MSKSPPGPEALTHELRLRPTTLAIAGALRRLDALDAPACVSIQLGVASSFTVDLLLAPLRARGYCDGIRIAVHSAPYGQFQQALIAPEAAFGGAKIDHLLLAVRLADVVPALWSDFNALSPADAQRAVDAWLSEFGALLRGFRQRSRARILCANFELPAIPNLGFADAAAPAGQTALIRSLNARLLEIAAEIGDMYVIDVDGLAARIGRERFRDPRLDLLARCPIAAEHHWAYAGEVVRVLRMLTGRTRKVLALDCDETLWGGILGDVGREGIALGRDFPGSAHRALQQRALELHRRGVVLVIASKNDTKAVRDVFENHPEMVLRPEHISYFAVNWDPKPQNLRQAAERLNLGLDSFVFVDDHPVECAMMREMLPEVLTVQLPEDAALYETTLAQLDVFDQLVISGEDRRRGAMYREEAARAELQASAPDLETFYRGLQMRMVLARNSPADVSRAAQLTQRTNQFNMTTIRRSEDEIRRMMTGGQFDVVTLRLIDRFGDNGVVGLAILERGQPAWRLDTFLMSCRVLGRTVETTFMSWLAALAKRGGAVRIDAQYIPSAKNRPFGDFYSRWGMQRVGPDAVAESAAAEDWTVDLTEPSAPLALPDWFAYDIADSPGGSSPAA